MTGGFQANLDVIYQLTSIMARGTRKPGSLSAGIPGGRKGRPIGINLSPTPGFRRGEGGWVEVVWALTVARHGSPGDVGLSMHDERAHHPGRPSRPTHPPFTTLAPTDVGALFR